MKQIMDFKMQNDMLNFKTYVSILETDLCTSVTNDPLKVFDHTYSTFLQDNLEQKGTNLTFRELDIIQQSLLKDRDSFYDCN